MNIWKTFYRVKHKKRTLLARLFVRKVSANLYKSFKNLDHKIRRCFSQKAAGEKSGANLWKKIYERRENMVLRRGILEWHRIARRSLLQKRRIANILNGGFFTRTTRAAIHQWKLGVLFRRFADEKSDHSLRLVENKLSTHRRVSLRNCLRYWRTVH